MKNYLPNTSSPVLENAHRRKNSYSRLSNKDSIQVTVSDLTRAYKGNIKKLMRALIISGYGINCEDETLHAFTKTGFKGSIVHINDLIDNPETLNQFQIVAFPGGFSYGDDTGSGNAMANKIKNNLFDHLSEFLLKDIFFK